MPDQPHEYVPPGPLESAPPGDFTPPEVRREAFAAVLDGIPLGAYDRRMTAWLTGLDDPTCRALASLMWRCRLAGMPGAVTEWGFRYTSDDPRDGEGGTIMPYPLTDVQQMERERDELSPRTRRTVVARQAGPWTDAEVPVSAGCRHCHGTIVPCEPPCDMPVCKGWKHAAYLHYGPVGAHYCEGRSVNPSGEPASSDNDKGNDNA